MLNVFYVTKCVTLFYVVALMYYILLIYGNALSSSSILIPPPPQHPSVYQTVATHHANIKNVIDILW